MCTTPVAQIKRLIVKMLGGAPMVETMEELLTVQEVAARLRVNEATVRRWIKNGSLEAIKLPHRGKREIYRVKRTTLNSVLKYRDAS
jgi:excisionase family DNA binding protein